MTAANNHWRTRITGTLTLESPLALGDGGYVAPKGSDEGGVDTVLKTPDGQRAVIPGSSLKGVLRAWLELHGLPFEAVMGCEAKPKIGGKKSENLGIGGKVEFGFCYSMSRVEFADEQSVAINRVTRAAAERLLFARQVVPAGTVFEVELLGFDLGEEELAALLAALEGFNGPAADRVRLGSGTNNEYGSANWKPGQVQTLGPAEVANWLKSGAAGSPWDAPTPLDRRSLPTVQLRARSIFQVDLRLDFSGWFLVKDPRKSKPKGGGSSDDDNEKRPDAYPLLTADNRVLLKPRGFRGAFRSQAERIARTLFAHAGGDPNRDEPAGQTTTKIVEALFGDTAGRAIVGCSPFVDQRMCWDGSGGEAIPDAVQQRKQTALLRREFVAIDRFTGGAAEHLKFDCVAAWRPQLGGTLSLDFDRFSDRCRRLKVPPAAAFGLLLLALRDLCDGDVSFGFGFGKGFGECRATIANFQLADPAALAATWNLNNAWPAALALERQRTVSGPFAKFNAEQRALISLAVAAARTYLIQLQSQVKP